MATSSPLAGTAVSAAGWGKTSEDATTTPGQLRSVVLKVGTTTTCSQGNMSRGTYFAPSMLCASNPGRDTCSGDSGGPLVATSHGHTALVGITSFGEGCARPGHPGVYTRVTAIRAWVLAQLKLVEAAAPRGLTHVEHFGVRHAQCVPDPNVCALRVLGGCRRRPPRGRANDDRVGDADDLVDGQAGELRVLADRLGAARLVDADGAERAGALIEHVAADPADVVGHLVVAVRVERPAACSRSSGDRQPLRRRMTYCCM